MKETIKAAKLLFFASIILPSILMVDYIKKAIIKIL
jgi:hypothetical protein